MNTYLFTWNPTVWDWTHRQESIDQLYKTGSVVEEWNCSSHKKVRQGDRAFLMQVGKAPKGIIGSAIITSNPYPSEFRRGENKPVPRMRVKLEFDVLLDSEKEPILTYNILKEGNLSTQNWFPQLSGISIHPELIEELEAVWFEFLTTQNIAQNPFTSTEQEYGYSEGAPNLVLVTKYERNPHARKKCLEHYGFSCSVCDINFQQVYGNIGKDFIHVHHLNPVSQIGKTYQVDPIRDLRPVCPNCHSMIHKRQNPYTLEEMKEKMESNSD